MTAQQILKLIEEVSPDDTAKLDEIDARVMTYLEGWEFKDYVRMYNEERTHAFTLEESEILFTAHFTRSRDALKQIRPEWWNVGHLGISQYDSCYYYCNIWTKKFDNPIEFNVEDIKTEELAELHAIIQAIEYERNNA